MCISSVQQIFLFFVWDFIHSLLSWPEIFNILLSSLLMMPDNHMCYYQNKEFFLNYRNFSSMRKKFR